MYMSETGRRPAVFAAAHAAPSAEHRRPTDATDTTDRWPNLVSQIGVEIAEPLTSALERINALIGTGRIDRHSLRALRDEVESARRIGMIGQQLDRFAVGRVRQSHERMPLADVVNGVLAHRSRETTARGVRLAPSLAPADVLVDASLLFSLLNATVDWSLANAQSQVDFSIDVKTWPAHAVLSCRFARRPVDPLADGVGTTRSRGLDSLTWRLIEQTAWTMGLVLGRCDDTHRTTLTLEFPRTVSDAAVEGAGNLELNDGFAASHNSQPLAGSHVLVVASRRDLRMSIREALRDMGLLIDFVNSVDEAMAFCREGLPHALVIESIQTSPRFERFREELNREVSGFVFIEVIEQGTTFEMSGFDGTSMARVGRDVLSHALPSALMFELSRGL